MSETNGFHKKASQILGKLNLPVEKEEIIHMLLKKQTSTQEKGDESLSYGDRLADKMAAVAGSWGFIIAFAIVLIIWIAANIYLLTRPFDPYPFILLNLLLSCIAAIQAPIIMMSQNRQEDKDRERALNDYNVNLKSEIILEDMHQKIDQVMKDHQEIKKMLEGLSNKGEKEI